VPEHWAISYFNDYRSIVPEKLYICLQKADTMFRVNEYYEGKVKSIAFTTPEGPATIGVMAAGAYEFGTETKEFMTVTSGMMSVQLPGTEEWKDYSKGQTFIVEAGKKFRLRISADAAYLCVYK
jgi:purine/pyrimidine-nucleoside phosphorylase